MQKESIPNPYSKESKDSGNDVNVETKVYNVTPMNQLIDINKDLTNFEAEFKVVSEGKKPFELLVIDQNSLDNNPEIPYKNVEQGEISGQISHDTNKFQNYYLILKSKEPCKCEVTIRTREIAPKIQPPVQVPLQNQKIPLPPPEAQSTSWFKILVIILGISVVGYVGYRLYTRKNNTGDQGEENESRNNPLLDKLRKLEIS